jgi:hypothetical protein
MKQSLTTTKEHKMQSLENQVLRKIFGPYMNEVTGKLKRNSVIYTRYLVLLEKVSKGGYDELDI